MEDLSTKKIKVDLTKIPYQTDVYLRSALPFLDKIGVSLLEELLFSSLETNVEELAETLELPENEIEETLLQLLPLGLFVKSGSNLSLNKERRRLLEVEAQRFQKDFHPDLSYLKTRLSSLPPSVLLDWYVVPRTCHDIFGSIVEKHFLHPRLFQRYIEELQFEDPRLLTMMRSLYQSDELFLSFEELQVGFGVSREELHTLILQLEYHFVAFLKYRPLENGGYEEVLVPVKEWVDFANWVEKATQPATYDVSPVKEIPSSSMNVDLRERQIMGVERRLRSAKPGHWVSIDQFLQHLDVPMHEPHELLLESKGRRWSYALPTHSVEDKATFRSLLFERFAKGGLVQLGQRDGKWYFSLAPASK